MKKTTLIIAILLLFAPFLKAQTTDIPSGKARIYVLRKTGFAASAVKFNFIVNEKPICTIKNNTYTIIDIDTGAISILAQNNFIKGDGKSNLAIKTTLESGKTYYFNLKFDGNKQYWEQITIKEIAEGLIKKLKITTCN
jgi:hypothetical protein